MGKNVPSIPVTMRRPLGQEPLRSSCAEAERFRMRPHMRGKAAGPQMAIRK
jgi:hypothetical protein